MKMDRNENPDGKGKFFFWRFWWPTYLFHIAIVPSIIVTHLGVALKHFFSHNK